jgi:hypothetical protein
MPITLGILSAAGATGSFDLLQTTTIVSDQQDVFFNNLERYQTLYKHLQIRILAKTQTGFGSDPRIYLQINEATVNYDSNFIQGLTSTVQSGSAQDVLQQMELSPIGAVSNTFSPVIIDFIDAYTGFKTFHSLFALDGSVRSVGQYGGNNNSSVLLSKIRFRLGSSALFATGSRFSLYGIKGE